MSGSNTITKVAVVGAGGRCGGFITDALLKTGRHTVTAITRADSESKLPDGLIVKKVDYSKPETLVEALTGQDALVITLSGQTPVDIDMKLINAAGEAGVSWIMPNEWCPDTENEDLVKDVFVFQPKVAVRKAIADLGKSSYLSLCTGFWYEWSLAIPPAYGIDLLNRKATLFDDGETKICTSTWPQVGRATAALLSLPIKAQGGNTEACLENYRNKVVYINSFTVSQKDMLQSAFRVTGTKESDWTITKEPVKERYAKGIAAVQQGQHMKIAEMLYSRVFYPDGSGDFGHKGTSNDVLHLPKEDMDEATKVAIERSKNPAFGP